MKDSITNRGVNAYSALLFVSCAVLAVGSLLDSHFEPGRVAVGCFLLFPAALGRIVPGRDKALATFAALGCLWLAQGCLSMFWTPDPIVGLRQLAGITAGMWISYTVTAVARSSARTLAAIRLGWTVAVCLTLPIAAHEIVADEHMPNSYGQIESGDLESPSIMYAAATFGNRNQYAAFLTLALPFVLWTERTSKSYYSRTLVSCLAMCSITVILINATRLGLLIIGIQLTVWIACMIRKHRAVIGGSIVILVLLTATFASESLPLTVLRVNAAVSGGDGSIDARRNLVLIGTRILADTFGLGAGAGAFEPLARTASYGEPVTGAINPHNVWIEVFSEYGVIVGATFLAWLTCVGLRLVRLARHCVAEYDRTAAWCGALIFISLPLVGLLNSSTLTVTFFWVAIGSGTAVLARYEMTSKSAQHTGHRTTLSLTPSIVTPCSASPSGI